MFDRRRIRISKWVGVFLAMLLLSQSIARWKAFTHLPSALSYVAILVALSFFLILMVALAVIVYAEERLKGTILHPRPWFDRMAERFFSLSESR